MHVINIHPALHAALLISSFLVFKCQHGSRLTHLIDFEQLRRLDRVGAVHIVKQRHLLHFFGPWPTALLPSCWLACVLVCCSSWLLLLHTAADLLQLGALPRYKPELSTIEYHSTIKQL